MSRELCSYTKSAGWGTVHGTAAARVPVAAASDKPGSAATIPRERGARARAEKHGGGRKCRGWGNTRYAPQGYPRDAKPNPRSPINGSNAAASDRSGSATPRHENRARRDKEAAAVRCDRHRQKKAERNRGVTNHRRLGQAGLSEALRFRVRAPPRLFPPSLLFYSPTLFPLPAPASLGKRSERRRRGQGGLALRTGRVETKGRPQSEATDTARGNQNATAE